VDKRGGAWLLALFRLPHLSAGVLSSRGIWSGTPLSTVDLQQRRAGGGTTHSFPLFPPPVPFLPCGGVHRNGETPKRVGGRRQRPRGLPIGSWSRRCRGKEGRRRSYWWPWRGGRRGSTPVVAGTPLASPGEGKRGQFLLAESLGPGRARAQALTCGPAHPRPSHLARRA
jgi:hypothetical protein